MEECFTGGAMEDATGDVMCGDLFDHIDDFLDFPNDDDVLDHHRSSDSVAPTSAASAALMVPPLLPPPPTHVGDSSTSSANNGTAVAEESKLKLGPYDDVDIAQLEWLSNFFDDSSDPFPQDFLCDVADAKKNDTVDGASRGTEDDLLFWTSSPVSVLEQHNNLVGGVSATSSSSSCSGVGFGSNHKDHKSTPPPPLSPPEPVPAIPGRARSKRPRPRPASFSTRPAVSIPFPPPSSDMESESFGESNPAPTTFVMAKNKNKKRKKFPLTPNSSDEVEGQAPTVRKCMHCEVTKTPQWRAGPMGPKTLCNACGVRYKSGRLFPEYRPAASPTFSPAVHSNSHKKVVEMRIKTCEKTAGVSATESPALKNCDLIEYIRRRV